MHTLKIHEGITESIPVAGGKPLESGKTYICTNAFAGSILQANWRVIIGDKMLKLNQVVEARPYQEQVFDLNGDWNNRPVWLMRGGGWGDLLMLTPLVRELQRRWPKIDIHIARGEGYAGVLDGINVTEEKLPIEEGDIPPHGILISYEEWIEGNTDAEHTHMAQHFADKLGITIPGRDYQPSYIISDEETAWANSKFPRVPDIRHRIGVQFMASAMYRTYHQMQDVVTKLLQNNQIEIFLFGATGQLSMKTTPNRVTNLTEPKYECHFRRSVAVAKTCDCIISPDSAMVHVASALEVPFVGLYGPIPAALRCSGKTGKGLQGTAPCSPCFYHAQRPTDFPANQPCSEKKVCVALEAIKPDEVVEAVMKLISPIIQLQAPAKRGIILPT